MYQINYQVKITKVLSRLPKALRERIKKEIDNLAYNPFPPGYKKLEYDEDLFRIRIGSYRVIYSVHRQQLIIYIINVDHRKDIYRSLR